MLYKLVQRIKRFLGYGGVAAAITVGTLHPAGLDLIKEFEGFRSNAYKDIVGVKTIGYGHTNAAASNIRFTMQDSWTKEYATQVLDKDLVLYYNAVDEAVTVDVNKCQLSVLTSWAYNVGTGAMRKSTLVRLLNRGFYGSVPTQLLRWDKAGGRKVRGLSRRRAAEAKLWETNCGDPKNKNTGTRHDR